MGTDDQYGGAASTPGGSMRDSQESESEMTPEDLADPDKAIRDRQEMELGTVYIGFGKVGFYSPNPYLVLPFTWEGTVLESVYPVIIITVCISIPLVYFDISMDPIAHQMFGNTTCFVCTRCQHLAARCRAWFLTGYHGQFCPIKL